MNGGPPPDRIPEWAWPRWYVISLGVTIGIAMLVSLIPAGHDSWAQTDKAFGLLPVAIVLDVLAAIGIALGVCRPICAGKTVSHVLAAVALFVLGTAALWIFVFFGCWAASRF
jgi:hypothetical protein